MKKDIMEKVAAIIASCIEQIDGCTLDPNEDLQQIGMDSLAFIRIIVNIEDEFQVEFPDDYLLIGNMNTTNKIVDMVMMLLCEDSIN